MGNLKDSTIFEIIENIKFNKVVYTFLTKGFTPFINFLKENNIKYHKQITSQCEMCEYLFSTDWFLKELYEKRYYINL